MYQTQFEKLQKCINLIEISKKRNEERCYYKCASETEKKEFLTILSLLHYGCWSIGKTVIVIEL